MPLKQPQAAIPGPFKALLTWLRYRRGLDLYGRINFNRGFAIGGIEFTVEDAKKLKALIEPKTKTKKSEDDLV